MPATCDMSFMNTLRRRALEAAGPASDGLRKAILLELGLSSPHANENLERNPASALDEQGQTSGHSWRLVSQWVPNKTNPDPDVHFEIYRAPEVQVTSVLRRGGDWRWRLHIAPNQILASGEGYRTERECAHAVDQLRHYAAGSAVRSVVTNT